MLKILQARLQQYVNRGCSDVQAGFRKGRGTRGQIAKFARSWKKQEFQKNIYFCLIVYAKAFDCVDHNKLWKILKEMGIPDHLTWLLRNLYDGQEATVRTGHGTTDWFQIGKGVCQGCILSPYFFNLYTEYIMRNARLDEAQAGIKIARRNINNLRYADDTSLIAESEEELREKTMAPHSSILAWKIPWMEEPGRLQSRGLLRVRRDWTTSLWFFTFMHWRRKWQPTPLFLPGESQGWGSLVGCRLGVAQHWTRLKWLRSSSRRRTKEPVDKSERGQWKSWLKTQHSEN